MKICFSSRAPFEKSSITFFKEVKKQWDGQCEGVFITMNKYESSIVRSIDDSADIIQINEYLKTNWDGFTFEKLAEYEKKYNCSPIWNYIYTDRFLINADFDYAVKTTVGLFAFYEKVFTENKIDYYYDEVIATLHTFIAAIVCNHHGGKYISQMCARGRDSTHHYFVTDPYQKISTFDENYKNKSYPKELLNEAEAFLKEFEEKDIKPGYMKVSGKKPHLRFKDLFLPPYYILQRLSGRFSDKYDYINYKQSKMILNNLTYYFRHLRSKKYYKTPDLSKKFVLFPLHYQPEASTIVCAPKYEKQLFFIDSWAKSLPADTLLYLKEHYAVLGHRKIDFYKQLKQYPNVVLVDPFFNTRELVKKAEMVTTLTGTVGWEAMLLRRPVVLGGNIFFDNAPGITKVDDIYGKYLEIKENYHQPEREEVVQYLCEYFSSCYKGVSDVISSDYYNPANLESVARAFCSFAKNVKIEKLV